MTAGELAKAAKKTLGDARLVIEYHGLSTLHGTCHLEVRTHAQDRWRRVCQITDNGPMSGLHIFADPKAEPSDYRRIRELLS